MKTADDFFRDFRERLWYLYDRLQDEAGYEDFQDYRDIVQQWPFADYGLQFVSFTTAPFVLAMLDARNNLQRRIRVTDTLIQLETT